MKNNKVFAFLKPIIVLTVIAAVMAALLGGTNLLTKDKIQKLEADAKKPPLKRSLRPMTIKNLLFHITILNIHTLKLLTEKI